MLPYNLLLFPLIGGFYLITHFERFKYLNQRLSPQMVIFNSIVVGIFLLLLSFLICATCTQLFPERIQFLKEHFFPVFPEQNDYFGTAVCSFFLGIFIPLIGNIFIDEQKALASAIERIGNELELLFKFSCEASEPLQITLKNNKVYVGYVELLSKPQSPEANYVTIIPLLSGYRDERKEFHITTNYSKIYAHYIGIGQIQSIVELEMNLVIQVSEIISATRFDYKVFEQFELAKPRKEPQKKRAKAVTLL